MKVGYQALKSEIFSTKKISIPTSLVLLLLSYIIFSRALDTGSYWEYLGGLTALILFIKVFIRSFRK